MHLDMVGGLDGHAPLPSFGASSAAALPPLSIPRAPSTQPPTALQKSGSKSRNDMLKMIQEAAEEAAPPAPLALPARAAPPINARPTAAAAFKDLQRLEAVEEAPELAASRRSVAAARYQAAIETAPPPAAATPPPKAARSESLQALALIYSMLKSPHGRPLIRKAVVVCPASLCGTWKAEASKWLNNTRLTPVLLPPKHADAVAA